MNTSVAGRGVGALATVVDVGDVSIEESDTGLRDVNSFQHTEAEEFKVEVDGEGDTGFPKEVDGRSRSTKKRGRRGARKSKTASALDDDKDENALAVQNFARVISNASRSSSLATPIVESTSTASVPTAPVKKASIWKLPFSKGGSNSTSPVDEPAPGTASNVSDLIMDLTTSAAVATTASASCASSLHMSSLSSLTSQSSSSLRSHHHAFKHHPGTASPASSHLNHTVPSPFTRTPLTPQRSPADEATTWTRGRRPQAQTQPYNRSTWGSSLTNHGGYGGQPGSGSPSGARGTSPQSVRSGGLTSSASSITASSAKSNWRSSVSSTASTSTSGFTRYSNSSTRSVNTMATSVSSGSWRSPGSNGSCAKQSGVSSREVTDGQVHGPPGNVKSKIPNLNPPGLEANYSAMTVMNGVPEELVQPPRQLFLNPEGDNHGQPSQQRKRTRKPKNKLDTINERPPGSTVSSPYQKSHASGLGIVHHRQDAATSTTDLDHTSRGSDDADLTTNTGGNEGATPKKVQKGQIHALAKMLSALRR